MPTASKPNPHATKTLYVGTENADIWADAQKIANSRDISLSTYVSEAVAEYNAKNGRESPAALARRLANMLREP